MQWHWTAALVFLLLLPAAGAQELWVKNTTAEAGGVAEVPIIIKGAAGIGSMDIILTYSTRVLELEGVKKGELSSGAMLRYAEKEPGVVRIGIVQASGISGDGSVAVLRFRVKGGAGDASYIDLTAEASDAKTIEQVPLKRIEGGSLTVVEKKAEAAGEAPGEEKRGVCGPTLVALLAAAAITLRRVLRE